MEEGMQFIVDQFIIAWNMRNLKYEEFSTGWMKQKWKIFFHCWGMETDQVT